MFKSVLVATCGGIGDDSVFATALAVARPFAAHLQFWHAHLSPAAAVALVPHLDYCVGPALADALHHVRERQQGLESGAVRHFRDFCRRNSIDIREEPGAFDTPSASWCEDDGQTADRVLLRARHHDLIVVGRSHGLDFRPKSLVEEMLVHCGRPILIAPDAPPQALDGTIVVAWKETPAAARALGAALPLLRRARRVVLLTVAEDHGATARTLAGLERQLAWHGIAAETRFAHADRRAVAAQLKRSAAELQADLLVVGGFEHGPLREIVFGGVTRSLLDGAELPVFMFN